jgi:hypothetical protein
MTSICAFCGHETLSEDPECPLCGTPIVHDSSCIGSSTTPGLDSLAQLEPTPHIEEQRHVGAISCLIVTAIVGFAFAVILREESAAIAPPDDGTIGSRVEPGKLVHTSPTSTGAVETATGELRNVVSEARLQVTRSAPDSIDGAGQVTHYDPGNMVDDDLTTAWRAPGDFSGEEIVLHFPNSTLISQVGLTNGYTKTDPHSLADRYLEERRIISVSWVFDDSREFLQTLIDGDRGIQTMTLSPIRARKLSLRVKVTMGPGNIDRDYTAISEIEVMGT